MSWPTSATRMERRPSAQAVAHVLHPVEELVGAAQRRAEHAPAGAYGLRARVPARARADEQAHLDAVLASEGEHLRDLVVRLQHDPAALADAVDGDPTLRRRRRHGFEGARPLHRRDLDAVLAAIGKPLRGGWKVVGVPAGQAELRQDVTRHAHR